ncbi:MAG: glycosyltransferase family 9 protein [Candidatus Rokubacteria bacterium]|nr:glycosyltransferase family 9 protein [Candidatus Rokubacteria bacterium]
MPDSVILRLPNWLGDTVMAVPALRALRTALPTARIAAAGPWVSVLAEQGLADVLVIYPRAWTARVGVADSVRRLGADTAVLLPNSLEAALSAWYWGAGRRIGFDTGGRALALTDALPLPEPRRHQIDEYLLLVETLGVRADDPTPRLIPPRPESPEHEAARALFAEAGLDGARRVIGVHLGAAWGSSKLWPVERVGEFCRLASARGDAVVLLGTAADEPLAAAILAASPARSLVGRDRPELLPALLARLGALVAADTGVAHLAAALGTPVLTLFGPTDPRLTAPRGPAQTLVGDAPCAPCFYRECPIDHPCMRRIGADDVLDRLSALMGAAG